MFRQLRSSATLLVDRITCLRNPLKLARRRIVREIFDEIPQSLGMKLKCVSDGSYEFRATSCVIFLGFARHETHLEGTRFIDPFHPARNMAFWILLHVLEIDPQNGNSGDCNFGKLLAACCKEMADDGRRVWREYKLLELRILDRASEVMELPEEHPIKVRFNHCDLRWLTDLEEGLS